MTLRQLQYFLAVIQEGSFTRAAEQLHVAQPSLSQQVRQLEQGLGGPLFERLPRSIRLTELGRQFEAPARAVLVATERAERVARATLGTEVGQLEIATVRSVAVGILPSSITRLRRAHPGVSVRLHEFGHRAMLEDRMRAGLAELAVGPSPQRWDGPSVRLGWEEFVVVVPQDDPIARCGRRVRLEELRDHDWVLYEPQHGLSDVVTFACAAAGFAPLPAIQTAQVEAAARLAAAGLGPALVPSDALPVDLEAAALPLDPPLGRELAAYARDRFTPLADAYVQLLRDDVRWIPEPAGLVSVP
jgi:DNA-binding transcriptional LysR family regulator